MTQFTGTLLKASPFSKWHKLSAEVNNFSTDTNALYYFRYDRELGDWAIVRELIFV